MKLANYYGDAEVHVTPIMTNRPSGKVRITISVFGESLTVDVSSADLIHQAKRSMGNDETVIVERGLEAVKRYESGVLV